MPVLTAGSAHADVPRLQAGVDQGDPLAGEPPQGDRDVRRDDRRADAALGPVERDDLAAVAALATGDSSRPAARGGGSRSGGPSECS